MLIAQGYSGAKTAPGGAVPFLLRLTPVEEWERGDGGRGPLAAPVGTVGDFDGEREGKRADARPHPLSPPLPRDEQQLAIVGEVARVSGRRERDEGPAQLGARTVGAAGVPGRAN